MAVEGSDKAAPHHHIVVDNFRLQGGRYDDNVAVFGRTLQRRMEGLKVFLVRRCCCC